MTADRCCFLGVDVGTGGVRAVALDGEGRCLARGSRDLAAPVRDGSRFEQDPEDWWLGLSGALTDLAGDLRGWRAAGLAVDSTSGSLLLAGEDGVPVGNALLYSDRRAEREAEEIAGLAPGESGAHGVGGGLAKLVHLHRRGATQGARYALSPADWLTGRLCGRFGVADENNALKLGYDPVARRWPEWIEGLVPPELLPEVLTPGAFAGRLAEGSAKEVGLPAGTPVRAGTTDSVAAFLATGARENGEAVTVLGSTLAVKVISERPVFAPEYGVYSHRLGGWWLPGGASNSGGAVLLQLFSKEELERLTPELRPDHPTGLDYLPLPEPGERFPDNDPHLKPRLSPRPESRAVFLQGLLEGIAGIEARGYDRLSRFGAPYPVNVRTAGGGASNPAWTRIRQRQLGVPVIEAESAEACFGAARLARGEVGGN